ncbi:MAG: hypothetical protein CO149_05885, partial [Nitrospirae bacterium CG_4_9_14_3_um_filter_51_5]
MKLLKQFLSRLSGNIFETLTPKLKPYRAKQKPPSLKLVSHNLHPAVSHDPTIQRTANLGHMSALESALQKGEDWLLGMQDPERGFWVE